MQEKTTLGLCTIVKNEEEMIGQCLESVREAVDEIVIVDTGSTDRTVEIAKSFGARVYHHPWQDSFSEARNYALKFATADWIIHLDADEKLEADDVALLREAIQNSAVNSYLLPIFNYLPEGIISKFYYRRLFRRQGAQYVGRVHNQILIDGPAEMLEIRIHHYGYNLSEEKMQAKYRRTETLIRKQIEDEPDNVFHRFNLVRILRNKGEYDQAIEEGLSALRMPNVKDRIGFYLMIVNDVCHSMILADRPVEIFPLCTEALKHDPLNMDLLFVLAGAYVSTGQYEEAIRYYQKWIQAKKMTNGRPKDVAMSIDTWSLEALVHENIAKCHKYLDNYSLALEYFERAIELDARRIESYKGIALCHLEHKRLKEALTVLERADRAGIGDAFVYYKMGLLCQELNRPYDAIHWLEKSLSLDSDNAEVWNAKSVMELTISQFNEARESLERCLSLAPGHTGARYNRIRLTLLLGEDEAFEQHSKQLLQSKNLPPSLMKEMADLCLQFKKYAQAISLYEKYLLANDRDVDALHNLSTCYLLTGNLEAAKVGYQAVLMINPNYTLSKENLNRIMTVEMQ